VDHRLRRVGEAHPFRLAFAVAAGWIVITVVGGGTVIAVRPDVDRQVPALIVTVVLAAVAVGLLVAWGDWGRIGFTAPSTWRDAGWLAVPAALAAAPLLGGMSPVPGVTLAFWTTVGLLTGFVQEAVWRGVVLQVLLPTGAWRAALASSALLAAVQGSVLFLQVQVVQAQVVATAALAVAQVLWTFCAGLGYAAIRLRTGALWPLMIIDALAALLTSLSGPPDGLLFVAPAAALLAVGVWLLRGPASRRRPGDVAVPGRPSSGATKA
jgi:membrane protease YdiL (CAAX protease family)